MKRISKCENKKPKPEFWNFCQTIPKFSKDLDIKKKKKKVGLVFFLVLMVFSMSCVYMINVFSFKKFHRQSQWRKELCGLGQANREVMRQRRSPWQRDKSLRQQEPYLLHLAWAPLHPRSPPFEQGDTSHSDSTRKRGSLPGLLISIFLKASRTSLAAVAKQEL